MQTQGQQKGRQQGQSRRFPPWIAIIIVLLLLSVGLMTLWIMNQLDLIQKPWSDKILPPVFTTIAAMIGALFSTVSAIVIAVLNKEALVEVVSHLLGKETPNASTSKDQRDQEDNRGDKQEKGQGYGTSQSQKNLDSTKPLPEPDSIFLFAVPLTNPDEFHGRERERSILINRTRKGASTSIVGPRRIGKTWLMTYLRLVAPTWQGTHYSIGYIDASLPKCRTIAGFTTKALEAFGIPSLFADTSKIELNTLEQALESLIAKNQTPILCIDEFEKLAGGQEFDLDFFTGLRAITQAGLGLVVASKSPLIDLVSDHVKTSPFFNIFEQLTLRPFNEKEAEAFAEAKGMQAGFTNKECAYLLEYGQKGEQQWPPLRLQLVGKMLLEDKIAAQTDPDSYLPDMQRYWRDFEKRLDETYKAVVRQ